MASPGGCGPTDCRGPASRYCRSRPCQVWLDSHSGCRAITRAIRRNHFVAPANARAPRGVARSHHGVTSSCGASGGMAGQSERPRVHPAGVVAGRWSSFCRWLPCRRREGTSGGRDGEREQAHGSGHTAYHPGDEQEFRMSSHAQAKGTTRAVAVIRASTGLMTHRPGRRKGASLVPRLARPARGDVPDAVELR